jgi:hypothetical protein
MVGTVYNNRSDAPQSFRYASLASGLEIVRKALGGQQIAVAQTTDIDRASGTVNRTHPTKTPGRCDLPLMVAQAAAALFCGWFAFQFQGSRSAILLAG